MLVGNGDATFQPPVGVSVGVIGASFAIGLLSGDGRPDIAVGGCETTPIDTCIDKVSFLINTTPKTPAKPSYSFTAINFFSEPGNTFAEGINDRRQIVGSYVSIHIDKIMHGFLYDGRTFTTLDVPFLVHAIPKRMALITQGKLSESTATMGHTALFTTRACLHHSMCLFLEQPVL